MPRIKKIEFRPVRGGVVVISYMHGPRGQTTVYKQTKVEGAKASEVLSSATRRAALGLRPDRLPETPENPANIR